LTLVEPVKSRRFAHKPTLPSAAEAKIMSDQSPTTSNGRISTETKITAIFVILGLIAVVATTAVTNAQWVHFAVLIGVGVVAPTLINEWRRH
jgi:hypothetical protein